MTQTSISNFLKTSKKTAGSDDTGQGGVATVSDVSVGQTSGCVQDKPSTDVTAGRFGDEESTG